WKARSAAGGSGPSDAGPKNATDSCEGVVSKSDYLVPKPDPGWSQNGTRVVSKWDIQETVIQETDQETAAAPRDNPQVGLDAPTDAAAVLVQELVSHGVSRTVAKRFAQEKPDVCWR